MRSLFKYFTFKHTIANAQSSDTTGSSPPYVSLCTDNARHKLLLRACAQTQSQPTEVKSSSQAAPAMYTWRLLYTVCDMHTSRIYSVWHKYLADKIAKECASDRGIARAYLYVDIRHYKQNHKRTCARGQVCRSSQRVKRSLAINASR
jgi:hypothetical protein